VDPLRIDVSSEAGTYLVRFLDTAVYPFDISISENGTDPAAMPSGGGRVHTSRWHLAGELPTTEGLVVDYAFFARVPTDGIPTAVEIAQAGITPDLGGDAIPNRLDEGSGGDGISDAAEAAGDGDGSPDDLAPIDAPAD